jgi:tetratricopeptide (TPR) repeat protein
LRFDTYLLADMWLRSQTSLRQFRLFVCILTAALAGWSNTACAQSSTSALITVEGIVRDSAGEPVASAIVRLAEKDHPNPSEVTTKADGTFTFTVHQAGTYTVISKKPGLQDATSESIALAAGEHRHLDLVLGKLNADNSSPSTAMEFEDKPNFTVAGISDSTAAGGHGSDASLRTSETLAKETLVLKSAEPAKKPNGDLAQVREQIRKLLAKDNKAELHRSLGDVEEQLGDPLAAVREYEQAARMDPSESNYFDWGTELLIHKTVRPALEVFTKGVSLHPKSARMLAGLGAALYASGSYDEAAQRLCDASDLTPTDSGPYLFLGKMEKAAPEPLPCVDQKLARFVQNQPENAQAHYYYAMALWKRFRKSESQADVAQVETEFKKAIALDPKLGEADFQLGILYATRGEFEQEMAAYKAAIAANPNLGEAHYRLGLAYKRTGEQVKAQEEFQLYEKIEKTEAAAVERERRELRQFLVVLKDQPTAPN